MSHVIPSFKEIKDFNEYTYVLAPAIVLWEAEDFVVLSWLRETYPDRISDWTFVSARSAFCTNDKDLAMAFKLRWG